MAGQVGDDEPRSRRSHLLRVLLALLHLLGELLQLVRVGGGVRLAVGLAAGGQLLLLAGGVVGLLGGLELAEKTRAGKRGSR